MAIGLTLLEMEELFSESVEEGLKTADGHLQAAEHGENPSLKSETDKLTPSSESEFKKGLSTSFIFGALLKVIDANNKAIEKELGPLISRNP